LTGSGTQFTPAQHSSLTGLRQGDLIRAVRLPFITVPSTSLHASELSNPSIEIPTTVEVALATSLAAVISGDCDLERDIAVEPAVTVAPVMNLEDETLYQRAVGGAGSSRIFAIPPLSDPFFEHQLQFPVIDVRWVYSLEKTVLASPQLDVYPTGLDPLGRDRLRLWLGRRFGRLGFPEDVQNHVVEQLIKAFTKPRAAQSEVARVRDAACFYGVRWTEGSPLVGVLVLLDPARPAAGFGETSAKGAQNEIRKSLRGKTGSYTVSDVTIADADEVSALAVQGYRQFFLDPMW
jgi:hypothetical protein